MPEPTEPEPRTDPNDDADPNDGAPTEASEPQASAAKAGSKGKASKPYGQGPYRTAEVTTPRGNRWKWWAIGAGVAALVGLLWLLSSGDDEAGRPSLAGVPPGLFGEVDRWPTPEPDLPVATPLAPLLVADQPEALAVLYPPEGAQRLRRGSSFYVQFNRPMVDGVEVGRTLETSPIVLDPPIEGTATWTSRSHLTFIPAPNAWTGSVREVRLGFAPDLASRSGEVLYDELERVLVFDGTPRVLSYLSTGRVNPGAPLPLVFDSPVSPTALRSELMAYEIGGGERNLPFTLRSARTAPSTGVGIDVVLTRGLEPGARIGLALAPRYLPWGGSSPGVMTYELAPHPQIEGIACQEGAAYVGQCSYQGSPGHVIDIGPTLRFLASTALGGASPSDFTIRPALRDMRVALAEHGPPQGRLISIEGEWEPDQVYEVRMRALRTTDGTAVRAFPPLAVRSSGHPAQINVASGAMSYEADALDVLRFTTINPTASDVLYRAVAPGEEMRALVSSTSFAQSGGASMPLAPLAPDARPNRWGRGEIAWRNDERPSSMAVLAFRPDPSGSPNAMSTAFMQATDLGVTVRATRSALLVWVTSISSGAPVRGAQVKIADSDGRERASGRTDADGVARIDLNHDPLVVSHAVLVENGSDRAALLLDPRRAIGPSEMGLSPGAAPSGEEIVATVVTDRGAYRPGEGLHGKVILRRVAGARAVAVRQGEFTVRMFSPDRSTPVATRTVTPSRYGTASVDFDLPAAAMLGDWSLDVVGSDPEASLGGADVRVAQFRQPTFRVDVERVTEPVHAGDTIQLDASATYLFGAPVGGGRASWRLTRAYGANYPEAWSRYTFTPSGVSPGEGSVAAGDGLLDAQGRIHAEAQVQLAASARTRLTLEAEVTDSAGHTHAGRRTFVAYPAEHEVGLLRGDDWTPLGEALEARAIAIDHEGAAQAGVSIEARFLREGWHSWWEWSEASERFDPGSYQMRRDQRQQVVHTCNMTSEAEPVACSFAPTRPGTYLVEVRARDAAGRESVASRRVYVAGPDEHPDRDPPGAPIAVTPVRRGWTVGETAELAFESPFANAEALITVEREGVLTVERRHVEAGGQVIRVPITEAMVPNAFVAVTLIKGRDREPSETVDLGAPDLRFGVAELTVTPGASRLDVTIEAPTTARPGTEVEVAVQLRDADGAPVVGEVALWAVDEGTLRLSGYQIPDPTTGLFRARPAAFAWEDLRRQLVSRIAPPPQAEASGDGNESSGEQTRLDDRERFDPTPLWAPLLTTDESGRATATIPLPERPTEYRVMALAVDAGTRFGRASSQLVAEQPLVVRPAFPRFLTAGDTFTATAFVHNATDDPIELRAHAVIGGRAEAEQPYTIAGGGELRLTARAQAPSEGPLELRFEVTGGGETVAVRDEIEVIPRGRYVRSQVFGAAEGEREITVALPDGTPNVGGALVTVASHPFVGFAGAVEAVEGSSFGDVESLSASLLALAAYQRLELADPRMDPEEVATRGRGYVRRLLRMTNYAGAFGRWSADDPTMPWSTALAVHALNRADAAGWVEDQDALRRARESLIPLVNGAAFSDFYGESGLERLAFALRVLKDADMAQGGRAQTLVEQRDRLGPYGLAMLALALGEDDHSADTLIVEACRTVLATREDEANDPSRLRWTDRSPKVLGAVLSAASAFEVGRDRTSELASQLLLARGGRTGYPWETSLSTAYALDAMADYAQLFHWEDGAEPHVALDGSDVTAVARTHGGAFFRLPAGRLAGQHRLRIRGGDDGPVFFSIDGRYAVALSDADHVARGRATAVHRVYETADGRAIEPGASVPLGELVRVRVFVYTEGSSPEMVALHDPIPGGFEAVDAGHDSTPRASLDALLGGGADDGAVDSRAHIAMRSLHSISHRELGTYGTSYFFDQLPSGLQEYTYALRATTPGTFTVPPTQVEALYDPDFVARSSMATLSVSTER
ncbi:MAG: alpha-2-macroglobulin [Sandaracinaceae bacterium]